MPKGVPKSGFRNTKKSQERFAVARQSIHQPIVPAVVETDEEILEKLKTRFDVISVMTESSLKGLCRSLIVSGPAGLGKSYTVEQTLQANDPEEKRSVICKGYTRATGLYKLLYQYRHKGNVIVFDDCDSVFFDNDALNLLKSACDTTDRRRIYWGAETRMQDDDGSLLPTQFEFEGSVILITNFNFDTAIENGSKLSAHFEAMISRAHYIDTAMHSTRDYLIRIKQVVSEGMLRDMGMSEKDEETILGFMFENASKLRELTLRMVVKIANIYQSDRTKWERIAKITLFKSA